MIREKPTDHDLDDDLISYSYYQLVLVTCYCKFLGRTGTYCVRHTVFRLIITTSNFIGNKVCCWCAYFFLHIFGAIHFSHYGVLMRF